MDTLETMTYEVTGRIARITLNRPKRGNGITMNLPRELAACVERANLDTAVHVIALSGNGSGFCGGYDLGVAASGVEGARVALYESIEGRTSLGLAHGRAHLTTESRRSAQTNKR